MNGISTFLVEPHKSLVESVWQSLEVHCGLKGVRVIPHPHFSYQVVGDYQRPAIDKVLCEIVQQQTPFTIYTTGIGVFTGEHPVITIPLVKDERLLQLHRLLWERTNPLATDINPLYSPELWFPHITIAYGDVTVQNAGCAIQALALDSLEWEIRVENLTLVSHMHRMVFEDYRTYQFNGNGTKA